MDDDHTEGSAAETLDRARVGGNHLVLTAHQRLAEVKRALDQGRFGEAVDAASSLLEKLGHLAQVEMSLGKLADARIMRADELEPGMRLTDVGTITEVGPCPNCGREECAHMKISFEHGEVMLERDDEMVVAHSD